VPIEGVPTAAGPDVLPNPMPAPDPQPPQPDPTPDSAPVPPIPEPDEVNWRPPHFEAGCNAAQIRLHSRRLATIRERFSCERQPVTSSRFSTGVTIFR